MQGSAQVVHRIALAKDLMGSFQAGKVSSPNQLADRIFPGGFPGHPRPVQKIINFAVSTVVSSCVLQSVVKGELAASNPSGLVAICNHRVFISSLRFLLEVLPLFSPLKALGLLEGIFFALTCIQ